MGLPLARHRDLCCGHSCFPPRPSLTASSTVFCNGRGVHRVGDEWNIHRCGKASHGGTTLSGSPSVTADGKPVARISDAVSCGTAIMTGSATVSVE